MAANPSREEPVRILLAEDNPGDVRLIREALREHRIFFDLNVVNDGEKALEFIESAGGDRAPCPDLILLDLNLPKGDCREVLKLIRRIPLTRGVPVMVLSSAASPTEQAEAAELGATCFIIKPGSLDEFLEIGALAAKLLKSRTASPD